MKKILLGCVILGLGAFQLPVSATNYDSWTGLNNSFNLSWGNIFEIPIGMNNDISAPNGAGPLTNSNILNQIFYPNGYNLTGGGGNNAVFHNEQNCMLSIYGGPGYSTINSNGSTMQTITNNGNLTLNNVTLTNGVLQNQSGAKLNIGTEESDDEGGGVTLSGNNNITAGNVEIVGTDATFIFNGGTIAKGAYVNITGPQNEFIIQNGNVTLNDSAMSNQQGNTDGDLWEAQVHYSLTGGTLTFDKFIHNTANSNGAYSQAGGTLNLTNASGLNLNTYSITTDGSGSGTSTVNIGSTTANDTSYLTVTSGVQMITAATGDTLTFNVGTPTTTGNNFNIEGGILDKTATVVINTGNSLNVSSGSATLNGSGAGVDTWNGAVNLSGTGSLTLDHLTHNNSNGIYSQVDGTLNVTDHANFTLSSGAITTDGGGSGTATVNLTSNGTMTLDGGSITTANAGGTTNINIGNNSSGNTFNISNATSSITNGTSGHTNINIGVGQTSNNALNLSAGSITGTGTTVNINTWNDLNVSGTGNLDPTAKVNINSGGDLNISGGTVTLNSGDTWNGMVNVSGAGNLTLNNISNQSGSTYLQTGGTANLANGSTVTLTAGGESSITGGNVSIDGSTLAVTNGVNNSAVVTMTPSANGTLSIGRSSSNVASGFNLNSGSSIGSGNTINIGSVGGTNIGNTLTVGAGATIDADSGVNIYQGNNLNIAGGTVTTGVGFNWIGTVNVSGTGSLTIQSYNSTGLGSNGIYTQTGANSNLAISDSSLLTLGSGSIINSGNVNVDGTSELKIAGGTLAEAAVVSLPANSGLNVTAGNATLNGATGSYSTDTWANTGIVYISGTGTLTLDALTHEAAGAGTYLQTGGTLNLTNGSNLTLDSGNSITAGNVGFTGTGSTLELATGATLASNAAINISNGNNLNVTGGTTTLNGTGTGTDTWNGNVLVNSGTLNLNGITSNGSFTQAGGTTNLASDSILTYGNDSSLGGGNFVDSGILNLSHTNQNFIASNITGSGAINKNGTGESVFTTNSKNFTGTYNQTVGTTTIDAAAGGAFGTFLESAVKNFSGGNLQLIAGSALTLKSTDTWTGTNISNGGLLTLDGFSHAINTAVDYNQSATGSLLIANGSTLNLGAGSSITTGNVGFVGTGNTLNIATGATFNPNFAFDIASNNNFNVSGGNATLDSANTTWEGNVNVSSGNLTLNNITLHGIFNQTGGTTTMDTGSILTLDNNSNLGGGALVNNGILNLSNTALATVATQIGSNSSSDGTSQVNKNAAGESVFTADNSGYTGTYNQSAGKSTIQNNFFAGLNNFTGGTSEILTGGNVILNAGDSWTNTNITNSGGALTISGITHDTTGAGTYNQSSGTTYLYSGANLTLDLDNGNSLSGGRLVNNATLNLTNATDKTVATSLSGNGVTNKNGAGTLLLTGQNLTYTGDLFINAGAVDFNSASGLTDSYISGTTHLAAGSSLNLAYDRSGFLDSPMTLVAGSTLNLDTNGHIITSLSNNISGNGTVNKTGEGGYTVWAGSNGTFDYNLNVTGGSMNVITNSGTAANFNAPVSVNSSTLITSAANTNFNSGLALDHGYLGILNRGFNVAGNMSVGSTVNTMNGVVATNNIVGDLNIGASGTAEFLIDISPRAGASDKYAITGDITTTNNNGVINIRDFRITGRPTLVQSVNLQVFDPAGAIDPLAKGITFTATDKVITSSLGQYGLTSNGLGSYTLGWLDFNPQVFRGQVATQAAYANQLTTNGVLFDHIGLVSQQLLSGDKPNVYANENPLFAPYQYSKKDGSLWYKGYGNIERLQLSQNINTQNNMWGSLVGADFPLVQLKHGWSVLPTAYVGYTGGYQTYSGVNMYQNGGQVGAMGTFYKGNFINSLLTYVGGYGNNMNVEGTTDTTGNWFAGVASKSAYNIKLPKDVILQPTMLFSYNAFGAQNWNSNFGDVGLTSGMLNGLNLAPGVNLILNKKTWSLYATTQLMFNLMNGVGGTIEDITLPTVKMGTTYFQYGLGFTKQIKDRLSMYGQVMFSNGVRTGVGFQGGLQWKF